MKPQPKPLPRLHPSEMPTVATMQSAQFYRSETEVMPVATRQLLPLDEQGYPYLTSDDRERPTLQIMKELTSDYYRVEHSYPTIILLDRPRHRFYRRRLFIAVGHVGIKIKLDVQLTNKFNCSVYVRGERKHAISSKTSAI
jgi:hypothetical protein